MSCGTSASMFTADATGSRAYVRLPPDIASDKCVQRQGPSGRWADALLHTTPHAATVPVAPPAPQSGHKLAERDAPPPGNGTGSSKRPRATAVAVHPPLGRDSRRMASAVGAPTPLDAPSLSTSDTPHSSTRRAESAAAPPDADGAQGSSCPPPLPASVLPCVLRPPLAFTPAAAAAAAAAAGSGGGAADIGLYRACAPLFGHAQRGDGHCSGGGSSSSGGSSPHASAATPCTRAAALVLRDGGHADSNTVRRASSAPVVDGTPSAGAVCAPRHDWRSTGRSDLATPSGCHSERADADHHHHHHHHHAAALPSVSVDESGVRGLLSMPWTAGPCRGQPAHTCPPGGPLSPAAAGAASKAASHTASPADATRLSSTPGGLSASRSAAHCGTGQHGGRCTVVGGAAVMSANGASASWSSPESLTDHLGSVYTPSLPPGAAAASAVAAAAHACGLDGDTYALSLFTPASSSGLSHRATVHDGAGGSSRSPLSYPRQHPWPQAWQPSRHRSSGPSTVAAPPPAWLAGAAYRDERADAPTTTACTTAVEGALQDPALRSQLQHVSRDELTQILLELASRSAEVASFIRSKVISFAVCRGDGSPAHTADGRGPETARCIFPTTEPEGGDGGGDGDDGDLHAPHHHPHHVDYQSPENRPFSAELHPCVGWYGGCRNTSSCVYAHVPRNVCLRWIRGSCTAGSDCCGAHRLPSPCPSEIRRIYDLNHGLASRGNPATACATHVAGSHALPIPPPYPSAAVPTQLTHDSEAPTTTTVTTAAAVEEGEARPQHPLPEVHTPLGQSIQHHGAFDGGSTPHRRRERCVADWRAQERGDMPNVPVSATAAVGWEDRDAPYLTSTTAVAAAAHAAGEAELLRYTSGAGVLVAASPATAAAASSERPSRSPARLQSCGSCGGTGEDGGSRSSSVSRCLGPHFDRVATAVPLSEDDDAPQQEGVDAGAGAVQQLSADASKNIRSIAGCVGDATAEPQQVVVSPRQLPQSDDWGVIVRQLIHVEDGEGEEEEEIDFSAPAAGTRTRVQSPLFR
ncbi:glucoamylase-like protein [Novymonas esmeraldas]|uniref:Glucoamylase-like protein n=1 Tax=Novymonas esmeraldas TaxID=1808958 RepID=A0AAW0EUP5_9TRYP